MGNQDRELSKEEIDLISRIESKGDELADLLVEAETVFDKAETLQPLSAADDMARRNNIGYAEKDLKQGIMWLVRSVSLPRKF